MGSPEKIRNDRARFMPLYPPHSGPGSSSGPFYLQGVINIPNEDPTHNRHHCCCCHDRHNQKSKKKPATRTPPPTSPHKFDQVAVFDVVAEVANIHAVLPLAMFGKLDCFFVWCIYWSTKRSRECFRLLAITVTGTTTRRAAARAGTARTSAGRRTRTTP
jgi:hypothetical protein